MNNLKSIGFVKKNRRSFILSAARAAIAVLMGFSCLKRCPESNWGMDYLCSSCQKLGYPDAIGECIACRRGTSSIALKLCNSCGCKLNQCQHCLKAL